MRPTDLLSAPSATRAALSLVLAIAMLSAAPRRAHADIVTHWNAIVFQIGGPAIHRTLAMVHAAMFDAVNSIERRHTPYLSQLSAPAGTSAEAAAAAAARGVLVRLFPTQTVVLDEALAQSIAGIANGAAKTNGLALGDQIAAAIVASRVHDNMLSPNPPYVPIAAPGFYALTPPNFTPPVNGAAGTWLPFALTDPAQFRPNGPRPITHPRYVDDFDEVRAFGSATGSLRTPAQTLSALWHVELAPPAFNRIARDETLANGLDLMASARLFALLNIAMADATMSVFEAKYAFQYWRPITAIRGADADANPKTTADPAWTPFLNTPPHPEYPSAHSVIQAAGIQVLESVFGQNYAFKTTSASVPGVTRTFASFHDYGIDGGLARIYGGIHFRTAVEEGTRQGRQIGNWILENYLR